MRTLAITVMRRCISNLFLPASITTALALPAPQSTSGRGFRHCGTANCPSPCWAATAVTGCLAARGDFATAGSVMFMLHSSEILREGPTKSLWPTFASAMSLQVDSVWQQVNGTEVLTKITDVKPGNRIVIRTGGMIPLDGRVVEGEVMVNQSSSPASPCPWRSYSGSPVYAGRWRRMGECVISVEKSSAVGGGDRGSHDRGVGEAEIHCRGQSLPDGGQTGALIRWGGTALTYLLTRM